MLHETDFESDRTASAGPEGTGRLITTETPQQCWITLDAAREQAFTGEIVFHAEQDARVYFDNGVAYYAERADDPSLGSRLLDAQVVDAVQLERGTVRVGGVEHLGRLFDRDESVDRDAVMVVTEDATQALLADFANNVIATSQATAYRHHESGVHRWFVAPTTAGYLSRPVSDVALVDNSMVEDLPGLPSAETGSLGDELRIEWDEPLTELEPATAAEGTNGVDHDLLSGVTGDAIPEILESPFSGRSDDPTSTAGIPLAPPPGAWDVDEQGGAIPIAAPSGETSTDGVSPATPDSPADEADEADDADIVDAADDHAWPTEDTDDDRSSTGFESLVIDLDALLAPVDGTATPAAEVDHSSEHRADHDAAIESPAPIAPGEVILPMDDEFLIVWPDGTEEAPFEPTSGTPTRAVDEPVDDPAIAGEVLLPHRSTEPVEPATTTDTSAEEVLAPVVDESIEVVTPEAVPNFESVGDVLSKPAIEAEAATEVESDVLSDSESEVAAEVEPESEFAADVLWEPAIEVEPESQVVADMLSEPVAEVATSAPHVASGVLSEPVVEVEAAADVLSEPLFDPAAAPELSPEVHVEPELSSEVLAEPVVEFELPSDQSTDPVTASEPAAPHGAAAVIADEPPSDPQPVEQAQGRIDFEVPALVLSDLPSADGAVPDEVSSAVLRAIRAIENASTAAPVVAPIVGSEPVAVTPVEAPPAAEPAPMGFAPPTLETSAEAMYAARAQASSAETLSVETSDTGTSSGEASSAEAQGPQEAALEVDVPGPRVASVVFVDDDEPEPEPEDRAGALRRLIGSLRRR